MLKTMTIRATIAAILAGLSMSAHAIADTQRIDIPAGNLLTALETLAKQANVDLVYQDAQVKGLQTGGVIGELSPHDAVVKLLQGTPLKVRRDEASGAILIMVPASRPPATSSGSRAGGQETKSFWSRLRLTQSDTPATSQVNTQNPSPSTGEGRGEDAQRAQSPKVSELEEIVVTGSHIRGAINDTTQLITLGRDYIDASGISTATGLMQSLPQNFALSNQSGVNVPGTTTSGEQGSSINLRGIGEGTTLVLLNGRRLAAGFQGSAVDISALPLSAVERVEILTDGASALYGSDAIGGTVNFILRQDFSGSETRLRAGRASRGPDEYRVSQALGQTWSSGNAILSMEFYKRQLLAASDRDYVPPNTLIGSLLPADKNYSGMFSGRQALTDSLSVFSDVLYTKRDSFNRGGQTIFNQNYTINNPQLNATAGITWKMTADWQLELFGSYAFNELGDVFRSDDGDIHINSDFYIRAAEAKADGPLWEIPGGTIRAAVGGAWRSERYSNVVDAGGGVILSGDSERQHVRSLYTEISVPLISARNAMAAAKRLDLSLAGRMDDYSSFGSSVDPRVGLAWTPVQGLTFRSSAGRSFKAPGLSQYTLAGNYGLAFYGPDAGSSTGVSHLIQIGGTDPSSFTAQRARNFSAGFDLVAPFNQDLKFGAGYYSIRFKNRIALPPPASVVLSNPGSFQGLFIRNPTPQQVAQYIDIAKLGQFGFSAYDPDFGNDPNFDPTSISVLVDNRIRNLAVTETRGIDASVQYKHAVAASTLSFGIDGTYILKLTQQETSSSAPLDRVNTYNNPPHFRLRASVGWVMSEWTVNLFGNYTDSYTDDRVPDASVPVSSWFTLDARLAYDAGRRFGTGLLSGVTVAASAQNLFNRDPPRTVLVNDFSDMGFDPANASPLGRLIAIELQKRF